MAETTEVPWMDGYYKLNSLNTCLFKVSGTSVRVVSHEPRLVFSFPAASWTVGDFGEPDEEIKSATGKTAFNVKMSIWNGTWNPLGVISDDGMTITLRDPLGKVAQLEWKSDEDMQRLREAYDPAEAPSSHYKAQPEMVGRLVFLSGAPGLGKSTSAQLMSKMAGYVYYEMDGFVLSMNPYIPPDAVEPSMAIVAQSPLKGLSQERIDAMNKGVRDYTLMVKGKDFDAENVKIFFNAMCKNILTERKRLGGDWVVAGNVKIKAIRDHIREQLGPDLEYIELNMTEEQVRERLTKRHSEGSAMIEVLMSEYRQYEPVSEEDSKANCNIHRLNLDTGMSREDVVQRILDIIEKSTDE